MRSAHRHFERCIELARQHGFGRIEVANLHMRGVTLLYQGDATAALAIIEEALERARLAGDRRAEMVARSCLCDVLVWHGDWARLRSAARGCAELAGELGAAGFEAEGIACQGFAALHLEGAAAARPLLAAARRRGLPGSAAFIGPIVLGFLALASEDPAERDDALVEGERILAAGSVSHNHLAFHPLAMEAWLRAGVPERLEAHAAALERYTEGEPLWWSGFFAAWGRALVGAAQGRPDRAALERLHAEGRKASFGFALPRLQTLLAAS